MDVQIGTLHDIARKTRLPDLSTSSLQVLAEAEMCIGNNKQKELCLCSICDPGDLKYIVNPPFHGIRWLTSASTRRHFRTCPKHVPRERYSMTSQEFLYLVEVNLKISQVNRHVSGDATGEGSAPLPTTFTTHTEDSQRVFSTQAYAEDCTA